MNSPTDGEGVIVSTDTEHTDPEEATSLLLVRDNSRQQHTVRHGNSHDVSSGRKARSSRSRTKRRVTKIIHSDPRWTLQTSLRWAVKILCWFLFCLGILVGGAQFYLHYGQYITPSKLPRDVDVDRPQTQEYPIILNPNDVLKEYRLFKLPNGLDVACVSDPQATKAAASMNVRVGSYQDPLDALGLAHFTEHLLGTDYRSVARWGLSCCSC